MAITPASGINLSLFRLAFNLVDRLRKAQQYISQPLERAGEWLNAREPLLVAFLVVAYIILALPDTYSRLLWHDELYTYNIALSASIPQMLECLRRVDLNPPLLYFLNYLTLRLPGAQANEHIATLAARLPSFLSGLIASLGLFALLRKRIGPLYSLAAVVVLWNTLFLFYASEDRPYALVCALLVLMILAWQRATQPGRNPLWVIAVLGLGCAMLGSHFMGCFLLLAFFAAEAVRIWQRGRPDILLGIALLVPFAIPALYRGKIVSYGVIVYPQSFQPSMLIIGVEYVALLRFSIIVFAAAMIVCLIAGRRSQAYDSQEKLAPRCYPPTLPERALLIVLLLEPMLFVVLQMVRHSAFFSRYGLPGCIPLSILMVASFYSHFQGLRRVALILVCVSAIVLLCPRVVAWTTQLQARSGNEAPSFSHRPDFHQVDPNLPFVVASGLTYVEMNHRESPEFLHRTYYLTDTTSAIKYAHATLFEGEAETDNLFHFKSHTESLQSFEAAHSKFLVLGTMDYTEDWLLRKLRADGDLLHELGKFESTYKDADLYEVTLNSRHK